MEELTHREAAWWRSPRLVAAAACFVLGAAVLAAGLAPRLVTPAPAAGGPGADPLAGLDGPGGDSEFAPPAEPTEDLIVYVSGAVAAPDVYRLPQGARVKDAVAAAGGLRPDAAGEAVNLAEPVSDAQHVHIPARVAPAAEGGGEPEPPGDGLIDLNRAAAAELEELPGVGKVLAERIVARREEQGPFTSVDELREVTGVGARLFEQIAPLVSAGR